MGRSDKITYIIKNTFSVIAREDGYWTSLFNKTFFKKAIYDLYLLLFFNILIWLYAWFVLMDIPELTTNFSTVLCMLITAINSFFFISHVFLPKRKKALLLLYGRELFNSSNIYLNYQLAKKENTK